MIRLTRHDTRPKDYESIFWDIGEQITIRHIGNDNYKLAYVNGPIFPPEIKSDIIVQAITWQRDNRTIV